MQNINYKCTKTWMWNKIQSDGLARIAWNKKIQMYQDAEFLLLGAGKLE